METTTNIISDIWFYLITEIITDFQTLLDLNQVNKHLNELVKYKCKIYENIKDTFSKKKGILYLDPDRKGRRTLEIVCSYQITGFSNLNLGWQLNITLTMKNDYYQTMLNYAINCFPSANFKLVIKDNMIITEKIPWNIDFVALIKNGSVIFRETPVLISNQPSLNRIIQYDGIDWECSWIDHFITKKNKILNQVYFNIVTCND